MKIRLSELRQIIREELQEGWKENVAAGVAGLGVVSGGAAGVHALRDRDNTTFLQSVRDIRPSERAKAKLVGLDAVIDVNTERVPVNVDMADYRRRMGAMSFKDIKADVLKKLEHLATEDPSVLSQISDDYLGSSERELGMTGRETDEPIFEGSYKDWFRANEKELMKHVGPGPKHVGRPNDVIPVTNLPLKYRGKMAPMSSPEGETEFMPVRSRPMAAWHWNDARKEWEFKIHDPKEAVRADEEAAAASKKHLSPDERRRQRDAELTALATTNVRRLGPFTQDKKSKEDKEDIKIPRSRMKTQMF